MLKDFKKEFGETTVEFRDKQLEVSNGLLQRTWQLTDEGLRTSQFSHLLNGRTWCRNPQLNCDWELPVEWKKRSGGKLLLIEAELADDEGFSSRHVLVRCKFIYESANLELDYLIWLYPGFAGMRTQFKIKSLTGKEGSKSGHQGQSKAKQVEHLPVDLTGISRTYLGYYSDTQNRNDLFLDILKEETVDHSLLSPEWNTWCSGVCLEDKDDGLAMVKESHKCVNKPGHDTGMFVLCPEKGLLNTGWGIKPGEVKPDSFSESWGTWLFCWDKKTGRESAFKQFDRLRFPIHADRDIIIQANTWGSTDNSIDARKAASEESVLKEIEIGADLGIDVIQIDDGWQVSNAGNTTWQPEEGRGWRPHPDKYTDGAWDKVAAAAEKNNVRLGLWAPAIPITYEELLENHEKGGFVQFKLDFAHLDSRAEIDALMAKARKFIISTGHQVKVNWDLTEIQPRYGYFFAREYGSIYLENRKPAKPISAVYRPATVLRDLWQISKYVNLNKFQCSYQNIDMVDSSLSNAGFYNHPYCLAITLMGTPLFFLETKYLSQKAKEELRPLIQAYKKAREEMFQGYVFPIGDKPDDASWTGFQNVHPETGNGYLTIFRELHNQEAGKKISLRNLKPGTEIRFRNLLTEDTRQTVLDENCQIEFSINEAPDFLFLKYDRVENSSSQ